ncbi:hypothetical protein T492DRAFT_1098477 [Pavlovales sp. CCMP2436]|nr:hypothetical protein T492DRAFT_1098477 [Pavlovales sp. CCMP2436]
MHDAPPSDAGCRWLGSSDYTTRQLECQAWVRANVVSGSAAQRLAFVALVGAGLSQTKAARALGMTKQRGSDWMPPAAPAAGTLAAAAAKFSLAAAAVFAAAATARAGSAEAMEVEVEEVGTRVQRRAKVTPGAFSVVAKMASCVAFKGIGLVRVFKWCVAKKLIEPVEVCENTIHRGIKKTRLRYVVGLGAGGKVGGKVGARWGCRFRPLAWRAFCKDHAGDVWNEVTHSDSKYFNAGGTGRGRWTMGGEEGEGEGCPKMRNWACFVYASVKGGVATWVWERGGEYTKGGATACLDAAHYQKVILPKLEDAAGEGTLFQDAATTHRNATLSKRARAGLKLCALPAGCGALNPADCVLNRVGERVAKERGDLECGGWPTYESYLACLKRHFEEVKADTEWVTQICKEWDENVKKGYLTSDET